MKLTVDITEQELKQLRQLNSKAFVGGSAIRTAVAVIERATAKWEEKKFVEAIEAYVESC